jgi:Fe-S oxidoreductase
LTLLPDDAGQREHPCGRCLTSCGTWSATAQPRLRYEGLHETLMDLHLVAITILPLRRAAELTACV